MNLLKENPFLAGLGGATALLVLVLGYFLMDAQGRFAEQTASFEQQKASLDQLHANKPFPSEANVKVLQQERDEALATLQKIGETVRITVPDVTPQAFQDSLRKNVSDIVERAAKQGVTLGDNFFLGFEEYETRLPAAEAAPQLALQLASIHNVASILVDAKVREIVSFRRTPLPGETAPAAAAGKNDKPPADKSLPDLRLAPFDVNFAADQSSFRTAFNRILEAKPAIFVRLVGIDNSSPGAPKKDDGSEGGAPADGEPASLNKPVVGQEHLIVNLELASISASGTKGGQ
jgi:hypothetical protein